MAKIMTIEAIAATVSAAPVQKPVKNVDKSAQPRVPRAPAKPAQDRSGDGRFANRDGGKGFW